MPSFPYDAVRKKRACATRSCHDAVQCRHRWTPALGVRDAVGRTRSCVARGLTGPSSFRRSPGLTRLLGVLSEMLDLQMLTTVLAAAMLAPGSGSVTPPCSGIGAGLQPKRPSDPNLFPGGSSNRRKAPCFVRDRSDRRSAEFPQSSRCDVTRASWARAISEC